MQIFSYQPLISIITVSYNSASTIRKTIESVLNQSYSKIEFVIVDGNSTDDTLEILEEYVEKFSAKGMCYKFISEADNGIYDALNKAIRIATGGWINIQGSDDWLEKDACKHMVQALNDFQDAEIIYGMTRYIQNNKIVTVSQACHDFLDISTINHQAIFFKRNLHEKFGYYSMDYRVCSDYEFLLRVRNNVRFQRVELIFSNYSLSGLSSTRWYQTEYENNLIRKKYNLISNKKLVFKQVFNYLKKLAYNFL